MNFVNRISLIITPKAPMHQWIVQIAQEDAPTFEEISNEATCYLLDEPEMSAQQLDISALKTSLIAENFTKIWNNELSIWDEFLDHVPHEMTSEIFEQWFHVTFSGLTFDFAQEPLMLAPVE